MNQEQIKERQNEEIILKCQYVARYYYNHAEMANYTVWLLCFASATTIFMPDTNNLLVLGIPLVLDIVAYVLEKRLNLYVEIGAKIRSYFDAYVLNIHIEKYSIMEVREIKEIVEKVVNKNNDECQLQISSNGNSNPPGVRDWYEFSHEFFVDARCECLRQNCWWNKQISKRRIRLNSLIGIIFIIMIIVLFSYYKNILRLLLCSVVVIKAVDRIMLNLEYYKKSIEIDGALNLLNQCNDEANIVALQSMINERRKIPVLEINSIHKRIAKKLGETYSKIS